jgi:hypothetical protein
MGRLARFQFELPESKVSELERLMEVSGVTTKRELFNNALTLLEWAIRESQKHRIIASLDEGEGTLRELQMPILSAARRAPETAPDDTRRVANSTSAG